MKPHERLDEFAVKHLLAVLRHLAGGNIGFDPARDSRTNTKSALISYIRGNYTAGQIDAAHQAAISDYPKGNYKGNRRGQHRHRGGDIAIGGNAGQGDGETIEEDPNETSNDELLEWLESLNGEGQGQNNAQGNADQGQNADSGDAQGDKGEASKGKRKAKGNKDASKDEIQEALEQFEKIMRGLKGKGNEQGKARQNDKGGNRLEHKNFQELLIACKALDHDNNHLNVWLHGPAGTGKTTAARHVAEHLGLNFYFNSALDTGYKLTGFTDANGRLVRTPFREAWEHGGVYLFDECDGSAPSALIEFNAALANGAHAFPDGIVPRHPDCIIIAGANTAGLGGTSEYVGRAKQDAAFMDRFVLIDWPIDEALELAICPNKDWCKRVQSVRKQVKTRGIRGVTITPRASVYGASLLAAGMPLARVEAMTLKKAMTDDQWKQIAA